MALESPLFSSSANMMSAFSPYTEFSLSPNSPGLPNTPRFQSLSARNSADSSSLHPNSIDGGRSPGGHLTSPSDMVGPSPVTSTGTDGTEIEDEIAEEVDEVASQSSKVSSQPLNSLTTGLPAHFRNKTDDEPASVIHAPQGYMSFGNNKNDNPPQEPGTIERVTPKPYDPPPERQSPNHLTVDMPLAGDKTITPSPVSPPAISTDIGPATFGIENATPRAQTRQELDELADRSRVRSSSASSLEGIPEDNAETEEEAATPTFPPLHDPRIEIAALKTALHECWTLCNTLASLSSIHRERIFSFSGTGDAHEKAWKCCWKLCQKLYDNRDDHQDLQVRPTLDLCRDFCQALFDVRQRNNEIADSVLRVSFELNNHLFNTHDRNLPEAFRERTLDFYITLCHRLMKQRSELAEETDSLLRACWSLAEMLFSLRQNRRDGKEADEELLGSAVQACWELCDLFREGWTQVRPERGTPRPSQTTFTQSFDQLSRSSIQPLQPNQPLQAQKPLQPSSNSLVGLPSLVDRAPMREIPETPTTDFEDTPISPEENSPSMPNILVLGTDHSRSGRWSSSSSNLSGYSQGSNNTSSTSKTATGPEDPNLTRLKILILKAAMNVGFERSSPANSPNTGTSNALQAYVKSLPTGSFGSLSWHANLLASYKDLVLSDPTFRSAVTLPPPGKRASALDISKSVGWMMKSGQYLWLKDLFKLVFSFNLEEAEKRKSIGITV